MEPQNNFPPGLNQQNVPLATPPDGPVSPVSEPAPFAPPKRVVTRLALLVLGVLVIAGGVYGFLTYNLQPTTDNQNPTVASTTLNIPADWKTYTNSQYGFEFRYSPTTNEINEFFGKNLNMGSDLVLIIDSTAGDLSVSIYNKPTERSLDQWFKANYSDREESISSQEKKSSTVIRL